MRLRKNSERRALPLRSTENNSSSERKSEWLPEPCGKGMCKGDFACADGPNRTHKCVCTSDRSVSDSNGTGCVRKVVPATPNPIFISAIIPPGAFNSSLSTKIPSTTHILSTNQLSTKLSETPIVLAVSLTLVLSIAILGAVCWWKRQLLSKCSSKGNHRKPDINHSPSSLSKGLLRNYISNPQYTSGSPTECMPVPVLPRDTLFFVQEIGEGCFGKVFKGELHRTDNSIDTVAVKVLKDCATKQAEEDFMREVEIMSTFRHEHILSLIGIVLKENGVVPWMVFEFMPYGDLAEVLRSNSKQLWKPVPGLKPLTKNCLLRIALQIAGGMKYLAEQRFVHNDLACRNCLVGENLTVKIADFGMSRDVYTCDYYRIGGSRPVPLRWMSPESVMYRRFTLESDVWSFGVVLWEIYSLGKQPYYGLNNEEVVKLILQGIMLIPPEGCPPFICDLMRACWKSEPKDRMKFPEIWAQLNKAREAAETPKESSISLPRPPELPVGHLGGTRDTEDLLDADNYLAPHVTEMTEYLKTLPY